MSNKVLKLSQAQILYQDLRDRIDALPTNEDIPEIPVQDVQVNGTSILSQGVANVPIANSSNIGAVKIDGSYGLSVPGSDGVLKIKCAGLARTKAGTNAYEPIVASHQHESAFYGLAKAAGDSTQSVSTNAVGTYTAEAKEAIQQMLDVPSKNDLQNLISISTTTPQDNDTKIWIDTDDSTTAQVPTVAEMNLALAAKADIEDIPDVPVQDVQINGNSILNNGIANIPYGGINVYGLVRTTGWSGVQITSSGYLAINGAMLAQIKDGTNTDYPIASSHVHEVAFYGLAKAAGDTTQRVSTNATGTYTTEAKEAIQQMLGVPSTTDLAAKLDAAEAGLKVVRLI